MIIIMEPSKTLFYKYCTLGWSDLTLFCDVVKIWPVAVNQVYFRRLILKFCQVFAYKISWRP